MLAVFTSTPVNAKSFGPRLRTTALAVGMLAAGAVQAQSLQEVYEAARAYDASYLSAQAAAESVQYRAAQADALARPSLGLGVSATRNEIDPPGTGRKSSDVLQAGLQAKYALFNRGNALSIEQAQRSLSVAQADLHAAEQDLIVRVAQAYFDVLAAQNALSTTQANKAAIAEQLASAKRNFEVGTSTITDTREAQAKFDLATAQELAAENDLRVKRVTLDQLVGRNGVEPKSLATPVALPGLVSDKVDTWVAQAEAQHPAIRKAQLGMEVARLEVDKAKAGHLPTVDLTGTLARQNAKGSAALPPGNTTNASVAIALNVPLYTGGATDNRVKEALALENKSRNDLEFARRSVTEGTRRAFFGVQSLMAQVKAYEAAEASTKSALEATQLGYKVGVRVNLDVLNAQTQLYSTQRDLAKARYDVLVNGLKLKQASGQLRAEDVSALNQLLAK